MAADWPQLRVLAAPMPALFQDCGRLGRTGQGIAASGPMDRGAFHAANRLAGNPPGTPCLELTSGGFSFESNCRSVIGLAGAPCPVMLRDGAGREQVLESGRPLALEPGDVVTLGQPARGIRSYLAVRGGFRVTPVLGSAATDTLAVIGPAPVTAGTVLPLAGNGSGLASVSPEELPLFELPAVGEVVTLDVILGPRTDWCTQSGVQTLTTQNWTVTPQSNRVGLRLAGAAPVGRRDSAELQSEGTAHGAIQIPPNGQPVLFLADHPLTGGYPVIATVAEYHLDLAGQIPVHAAIRFRPIAPFREIP